MNVRFLYGRYVYFVFPVVALCRSGFLGRVDDRGLDRLLSARLAPFRIDYSFASLPFLGFLDLVYFRYAFVFLFAVCSVEVSFFHDPCSGCLFFGSLSLFWPLPGGMG